MSVLFNQNGGIGAAGGGGGATGDERSLRLKHGSYLSRTFGSPSNQDKWAMSCWVKLQELTRAVYLLSGPSNTNTIGFDISGGNKIDFNLGSNYRLTTSAVYRDPSGFLHFYCIYDAANGTASLRLRLYINGTEVTSLSTDDRASIGAGFSNINTAAEHQFGRFVAQGYSDYYLADLCFVDNGIPSVSSFGETNANGIWVPKTPASIIAATTFGNNGFFLDFRDVATTAGSNAGLGKDTSGNGNYWTTNNISVTSGSTYDSMYDYPLNAASGTQPVGNYATLNPIVASAANITNGALTSGTTAVQATIDAGSVDGGAYWEVTAVASAVTAGVINESGTTNTTTVTANKTFGFRLTSGDALDYINITDAGAWTSITTGLTGVRFPYGVTQAANWNFGQRPFLGTASGKALCTANLPDTAVITSGSFTGNAAADGPFVYLAGTPTTMTIDGNAVTWGTHADKLANGFKVRTASSPYNDAGSNNYSVSVAGDKFSDNNRGQSNP